MKNKLIKSRDSVRLNSLLSSNLSESTNNSSKLSQRLLKYYKRKSEKLEKEFENLLDVLGQVKSTCDFSYELQTQLGERNEEISKLQQIIGELQIHLFREKEENLKLSAECDELRIQEYENTKRLKALLAVTGMCERKYMHFVTTSTQDKVIEPKLPPKLQKLKDEKQKEVLKSTGLPSDVDPQNQLLASQLEQHIKLSGSEINVLLKEKELMDEERNIERQRLQKEINLLTTKLRQSQDLLCEAMEKLIKAQQGFEKEKTSWMEEKEKYQQVISRFKDSEGIDVSDVFALSASSLCPRSCGGRGLTTKGSGGTEKEQMNAFYQEQILALEAEVNRLRESAQMCKNKFKEKTEKMTAQVSYLKSKYEDLDRRRHLEAEGFRTDIRMLRERMKELEKKLAKASGGFQGSEQQQLLISARSTLNRAKQLEKELSHMKSKISLLESKEEDVS